MSAKELIKAYKRKSKGEKMDVEMLVKIIEKRPTKHFDWHGRDVYLLNNKLTIDPDPLSNEESSGLELIITGDLSLLPQLYIPEKNLIGCPLCRECSEAVIQLRADRVLMCDGCFEVGRQRLVKISGQQRNKRYRKR